MDNVETASALSQHSEASSCGSALSAEARAAASSAPVEEPMLELSGSEELDILGIEAGKCENSPPHSPAFEELLEVVTRAVEKLKIDWPPEMHEATKKSKPRCRDRGISPSPREYLAPMFIYIPIYWVPGRRAMG